MLNFARVCLLLICFWASFLAPKLSNAQYWEWAKSFVTSNGNAEGKGIGVDSLGFIYVAGNYAGTLSIGAFTLQPFGSSDMFIAKFDTLGQVVWAQRIGGQGPDFVEDLHVDAAGNCYLTGQYSGVVNYLGLQLTAAGNVDVHISKISSSGSLVWVRSGGSTNPFSPASSDIGQSIAIDNAGAVYVSGLYAGSAVVFGGVSTGNGNPNGTRRFLIKYTGNGSVVWIRTGDNVLAKSDIVVPNGLAIAATYSANFFGGTNFFRTTTTYNLNGIFVNYGDSSNLSGRSCISADAAGNIYMGNQINNANIQVGNNILSTTGSNDIVLVKYAPTGNIQWVRQLGGSGNDEIMDIVSDDVGNSYFTGGINNVASFDSIIVQASGTRTYVSEFNSNGSAKWVLTGGGGSGDMGNAIIRNSKGEIYVTGKFIGSATYGSNQIQGAAFSDGFIAKIGCKPQLNSILGDTLRCLGSANFSIDNPKNYNAVWSINHGTIQSSNNHNVQVNFPDSGIYFLSVYLESSCGRSQPITKQIRVRKAPSVPSHIQGDSLLCLGSNTFSVATQQDVSYHWSLSSGKALNAIANNAVVNYNTTGIDTISLSISNICGNSPVKKMPLLISEIPQQPGVIAGDLNPCTSVQSYTIAQSASGVSNTWSVSGGGNVTFTNNSALVNWNSAGTYNLSVSPSNYCGIGQARSVNIAVRTSPEMPNQIIGNSNPCQGLHNYEVLSQSGVSYTWALPSGGGAIVANNSLSNVIWNNTGNFEVRVTPSNSCGLGPSKSLQVKVDGVPSTPDTILGIDSVCLGNQNYRVPGVTGLNYVWSLSSGGIMNPQANTTNINWISEGSHQISIIASNQCGSSAPKTLLVSVDSSVNTFNNINGNTNTCFGLSNYQVPLDTGLNYSWSLSGGGVLSSNANTAGIIWDSVGTHSLLLESSSGCSNVLFVSVNTSPGKISGIIGDTAICTGTSAFSLQPKSGENYVWFTKNGAGITTTPTGNNAFINFANEGVDTVNIIASNNCGAGPVYKKAISVFKAPNLPTISGDSIVCSGSSTIFSSNLDTTANYIWGNNGGLLTFAGNNAQVFWPDTGNFTLNVRAENFCGSSLNSQFDVEVIETASSPDSIFGNDDVCLGFQAYNIDTSKLQQYNWVINGGGVLTQNGPFAIVNWSQPGDYFIGVIPSNSCGTGALKTKHIEVRNVPSKPQLTFGDTLPCLGTKRFAINAENQVSYQWQMPGTNLITANADSAMFEINGAGIYQLEVIPSNTCGIGSSLQVLIEAISIPAAPNVSGDTNSCLNTLAYSVPFIPGEQYTWSLNGGGILSSTANLAQVNWLSPGLHTINVSPQNKCGTGTIGTHNIRVKSPPPKPNLSIGDTLACLGNNSYVLNQIPNTSFDWFTGLGNFVDTTNVVNLNFQAIGNFEIKTISKNECGISDSLKIDIRVIDVPSNILPIFGDTVSCLNSSFYYSQNNQNAYLWSISGGGSISNFGDTSVVSWSSIGTHFVRVSAQNKCGAGPQNSLKVVVTDIPQQPGVISGNLLTCKNSLDTFTVASSAGINYVWNLSSGGNITSIGNKTVIDWSQNGLHQLSVTPFNLCGTGNFATTFIDVRNVPNKPIAVQIDSIACVGNSFYQVNTPSSASIIWSLNQGGNLFENSNNAFVNWLDTGSHLLSVNFQNFCGNSDSLKLNVHVGDVPQSISAIIGDTAICIGEENYEVIQEVGNTYLWNLSSGGLINASDANAIITWTSPGIHNIQVAARNECGVGASESLQIRVFGLPQPLVALSGETRVCVGSTSAYETTQIGDIQYQWSLTGNHTFSENENFFEVAWSTPGIYVISVFPRNECGLGFGQNVNIEVLDVPSLQGGLLGDSLVCQNEMREYLAPSVSNTNYTWQLNNNSDLLALNNSALVVWNKPGKDTLSLVANNECGSSGKISKLIEVDSIYANPEITNDGQLLEVENSDYRFYQWYKNGLPIRDATSSSYSAEQSGFYQVAVYSACKTLSFSEKLLIRNEAVNDAGIVVYPNPAGNFVWVSIPANVSWDFIDIYNVLGRKIDTYKRSFAENEVRFQLVGIGSGTYLIQVHTELGFVTKKLVIDKLAR